MMLSHRTFVYGSRDEFVESLVPFVADGLANEEPVLVVTSRDNIAGMREALGRDADAVEFRDSAVWYTRPAETLDRYAEKLGPLSGGPVRAIGEPTWCGSPRTLREWARYESAINVTFAGAPLNLICPYSAELDERIIEHARATHPAEVTAHGHRPCGCYVEPSLFPATLAADALLSPLDSMVLRDGKDLASAREFTTGAARDAGIADERVGDVVLAVSELAANALRHGRQPAGIRIGAQADDLVCEVYDGGVGLENLLAGWSFPSTEHIGGWGLALTRRLADGVEILSNGAGSVVRVHFERTNRPAPATA